MKADYIIRAGEPLSLSLLALEGNVSIVTSVSAKLKEAGPNGAIPTNNAATIANFTVSNATMPDIGWSLILTGAVTQTLKPGFYITNAKLDLVTGGPLKTDHILIEIRGSVT